MFGRAETQHGGPCGHRGGSASHKQPNKGGSKGQLGSGTVVPTPNPVAGPIAATLEASIEVRDSATLPPIFIFISPCFRKSELLFAALAVRHKRSGVRQSTLPRPRCSCGCSALQSSSARYQRGQARAVTATSASGWAGASRPGWKPAGLPVTPKPLAPALPKTRSVMACHLCHLLGSLFMVFIAPCDLDLGARVVQATRRQQRARMPAAE